jgi:hypothetical protein
VLAALFAYEKRKVVIVDIEGAFLHGKIKNLVIIEVGGKCTEVMVSKYPTFTFKNWSIIWQH